MPNMQPCVITQKKYFIILTLGHIFHLVFFEFTCKINCFLRDHFSDLTLLYTVIEILKPFIELQMPVMQQGISGQPQVI